ncbi:MAG TPA: glycosyltransferase family 39 protein, partial [Bacteroidales bacterium]|nr:glycosyltransferase family 39 protein [Bacteroidales bacterium]
LCGTFILPDAPQVCFWLATLLFLLKALPDRELTSKSRRFILFAGVTAGLAMLSKYHSAFLLLGVVAYVLFYNRKWFRAKEFYGFFVIAALLFLPVLCWNIGNNFMSFTYHENRVTITGSGLRPQYFLTEVVGEFFYNNPVNVVIIVSSLIALVRRRQFLPVACEKILLWTSIPLVLVFLSFSLFRSTLPHWTGPGYLGLIILAAAFLSEPSKNRNRLRLIPWPLALSLAILLAVAVTAMGQIRYGWIRLNSPKSDDPSLDMTGWKQLGEKFAPLAGREEKMHLIAKGSPILTFRWFPAANFDYYLAKKIHKPVYALGSLERIHKYHWINQFHGSLWKGSDAWFIALSDDYEDPVALYGELFTTIVPTDTLFITRGRDTVRRAFVFRMLDLKKEMVFQH